MMLCFIFDFRILFAPFDCVSRIGLRGSVVCAVVMMSSPFLSLFLDLTPPILLRFNL